MFLLFCKYFFLLEEEFIMSGELERISSTNQFIYVEKKDFERVETSDNGQKIVY